MPDRVEILPNEEARLVTETIGSNVRGATVLHAGERWQKKGVPFREGVVPEGKSLVIASDVEELGQLIQAAINAGRAE